MVTTSTVVTVKAQIVSQLTTALATAGPSGGQVPVDYAWPGPQTQREHVFLGRHPELDDIRLSVEQDIPTLKAGRKHRQENYTVQVTVWTFRPELSSTGAQTCETRAFALVAEIEDVLADDPRIGLAPTVVQSVKSGDIASTLFPFEKGWACECILNLDVSARLQ